LAPPAVEQMQPTLAPPQVGVWPEQATHDGPQKPVAVQAVQLPELQ